MEISIKERLIGLRKLQDIDSQLDEIKSLQGSLPEEARELEDTLVGLRTRKEKLDEEIIAYQQEVSENKNKSQDSEGKIKHYEAQQENIRNNREYAALAEQIEYQKLEIQHLEQKNKKLYERIIELEADQKQIEADLQEQEDRLGDRHQALEELETESKQDAEKLATERQKSKEQVEERLLHSYERIRTRVRNGLAIVSVVRGACGGCFNQVPPQRQAEVREQRKLLVCEHCGRIFSDLIEEEIPVKPEKKKRAPAAKKATTKKDTAKKVAVKKETAETEAVEKETAETEAVEKDTVKKDTVKKVAVKKEAAEKLDVEKIAVEKLDLKKIVAEKDSDKEEQKTSE